MADVGVLTIDAMGVLIVVWLFQLVRRDRLYVGYGVIFVLVIAVGLFLLTVPAAMRPLEWLGGLAANAPALIALGLAFVTVMLIYVLSQVTLVSNRLTMLAQELAIRDALASSRPATPDRPRTGGPGSHD